MTLELFTANVGMGQPPTSQIVNKGSGTGMAFTATTIAIIAIPFSLPLLTRNMQHYTCISL